MKWALQSFGQVVFLCQSKVNDECMVLRPGWVEQGEVAPAPIQAFSPLWKMPLNCTTFSPRESAWPTYLPRANGGYTCAPGTPASLNPEWNYPHFLRGENKNQNNKTRSRSLEGWRAFFHCFRRKIKEFHPAPWFSCVTALPPDPRQNLAGCSGQFLLVLRRGGAMQ